uniref:Uncharacterized protein n=1 Tax=Rhizophora mucronata TaxID=61149 RepID=A0A2P2IZF7_RHIMU
MDLLEVVVEEFLLMFSADMMRQNSLSMVEGVLGVLKTQALQGHIMMLLLGVS